MEYVAPSIRNKVPTNAAIEGTLGRVQVWRHQRFHLLYGYIHPWQ